jgi:hypothetical protein
MHFHRALPARFQPHLPYLITSIVQQSNATNDIHSVMRIIIKYQLDVEQLTTNQAAGLIP